MKIEPMIEAAYENLPVVVFFPLGLVCLLLAIPVLLLVPPRFWPDVERDQASYY